MSERVGFVKRVSCPGKLREKRSKRAAYKWRAARSVQKEGPDDRSGLFTHAPENGRINGVRVTELASPQSHQYWGHVAFWSMSQLPDNQLFGLLPLGCPFCCGFVAGLTSIPARIYRYVADVAARRGGKGGKALSSWTVRSLEWFSRLAIANRISEGVDWQERSGPRHRRNRSAPDPDCRDRELREVVVCGAGGRRFRNGMRHRRRYVQGRHARLGR